MKKIGSIITLVVLISPIWGGRAEIVLREPGVYYCSLLIGEGRNDDISRLYLLTNHTAGNSSYSTVRELTFSQGKWLITPVCSLRVVGDITLANGRNDGLNRLYITVPSDSAILEYTFSEDRWQEDTVLAHYFVPSTSYPLTKLLGAPLRRDNIIRLYCIAQGKILEISYSDGIWKSDEINASTGYFIGAGPGRNDDTIRLYTGSFEITYYSEGWRIENLPFFATTSPCMGDGRGDSIIRLYDVAQRIQPFQGEVWEYAYIDGGWREGLVDAYPGRWLASTSTWDAKIGIARRDNRSRLYFRGAERDNEIGGLYEYTFSDGEWDWTFIPFPDSSSPFPPVELKSGMVNKSDRLAMGKLRNDDTSRIYCITWSDSCLVEINMEALGINERSTPKNGPISFSVSPNPCYGKIRMDMSTSHPAELLVYNVLGQLVKDFGAPLKGKHTLYWDGRDRYGRPVGSGVYLCVLRAPNQAITKKIVILQRKEAR